MTVHLTGEWALALSFPFLISLMVFILVVAFNRRSLWSGAAALGLLFGTGLSVMAWIFFYGNWIMEHRVLMFLLLAILLAVALILLFFPFLLAAFFIFEGVRLIRREGFSFSNCLSLGFGLLILLDLFLMPSIVTLVNNPVVASLYIMLSECTIFFSAQLAVYCLSALVNLTHFKTPHNLDQIVVLGSGIFQDQVPPLLQSRIAKGISLQKVNPKALLILSGGQGPNESIPEGEAMEKWALSHGAIPARTIAEKKSANTWQNLEYSRRLFPNPAGQTAIVTTRYHVFRALLLSKKQGFKALGFGSKTKWYFSLNALLREFAAYLSMTRKRQIIWLAILLGPFLVADLIALIFR